MGEFRSILGEVPRKGQFSTPTERASHHSKVSGWSMSQRKVCVTDNRFVVFKLLICVPSLSSPLPMEMSVLSVFLHLS